METRPSLPSFTFETAAQKIRLAEDAQDNGNPERVAQGQWQ
jgi:nuclear transport factor 2 (NTF2) superfamily protein